MFQATNQLTPETECLGAIPFWHVYNDSIKLFFYIWGMVLDLIPRPRG